MGGSPNRRAAREKIRKTRVDGTKFTKPSKTDRKRRKKKK